MGWLLHCNTGSLRKHKPSVPSSVLLPNNYVIVKTCSRNITDSTNLAYSKKSTYKSPPRLSCQGLPSFLGKEKSAKCTYFATGRCFIHPALIFAPQSLITSLQHIKLCISLLSHSRAHSALTNVVKDPLLIVRVILLMWSIKTLILSSLRR